MRLRTAHKNRRRQLERLAKPKRLSLGEMIARMLKYRHFGPPRKLRYDDLLKPGQFAVLETSQECVVGMPKMKHVSTVRNDDGTFTHSYTAQRLTEEQLRKVEQAWAAGYRMPDDDGEIVIREPEPRAPEFTFVRQPETAVNEPVTTAKYFKDVLVSYRDMPDDYIIGVDVARSGKDESVIVLQERNRDDDEKKL